MKISWLRVLASLLCLFALYVVNFYQTDIGRYARTLWTTHKTIRVDQLDQPIDFGAADKPSRAYVEMDFDFKPASEDGYPNLFQTSDANRGMRAELSGGAIGLVASDKTVPGGIRGDKIADGIEVGTWYHLRLRALNHGYVHTSISGSPSYDTWERAPEFAADHIMLGRGFAPERAFRGEIRNARLTVGIARPAASSDVVLAILKLFAIGGFAFSLLGYAQHEEPTHTRTALPKRSYDPLLILRAFACLLVVVGHGMMITHRPADLNDLLREGQPAWLLTASPWAGVWVFFVLSGYLMGKGFVSGRYQPDRQGIGSFFRNRLLRIAPMYWASVLIVAALVHPEALEPENWLALAHILLFDPEGQSTVDVIGALWSVGTEVQFYLLVPLAFFVVRRFMGSWLSIALSLVVVTAWGLVFRTGMLSAYGFAIWPREVYKTLAGNIDLFLFGFLLNFAISKARIRITHGISIGFLLMAVGYVAIAYPSAQGMLLDLTDWRDFLLGVCPTLVAIVTCLVIACFELGTVGTPNALTWLIKKAEVFGLMTYAIYVWHEPILLAASTRAKPIPDLPTAIWTLLLAIGTTLVVSRVMYRCIEVPFEKKKTRQEGVPSSDLPK